MNILTTICLSLFILAFIPATPLACSSHWFRNEDKMVVGRNLDLDISGGYAMTNKRGVTKVSLVDPPHKPVQWISKYGSVTVNLLGKEFPLGGMNEAGLVVEHLALGKTRYPAVDERPGLLHFQWIQYQLDNHSSVEEVINSDGDIRIIPHEIGMHFLICDSSGNVAVIEFLEGKMVSYTGDELPIAALTNNPYETTIKYMAEQAKGSHDADYGKSLESITRSVMQLEQIDDYHALESKPDIYDYSFSILNSVGSSATQWSIVYDIGKSRILYRTRGNQDIRILQLRNMDFSYASTEMVLAADANPDDSDSFEEFSLSLNEKLINEILSSSSFLSDCLKKYRDRMIAYPRTTSATR